MKTLLKKILPEKLLKIIRPLYHGLIARGAVLYFNNPSEKMVVIGVTGTAGKSSTTAMLAEILNFAQKRCGYITTVDFFDGQKHFINKHGLSMPNEILLQKQLRQMVLNGCEYAVVECTSEGLAQGRHLGINFDAALFTNLSRAHLQSHGSYGNYQKAKGELFKSLSENSAKKMFPEKMIGVNFDDAASGFFYSFPAKIKFGVTFNKIKVEKANKVFFGKLEQAGETVGFDLNGQNFVLNFPGNFNAQNASLAAAMANMLGVDLADCAKALSKFSGVPGRMQKINNSLGVNVIVDYGCEPASFLAALESTALLPHKRIIHVFGSTGGHRDEEKRFLFGKTSAEFAHYIIVTNDDVYESDPQKIAQDIKAGIRSVKLNHPPVETILDRREAINRALSIALPEDLVLITGKGSEQFLVLPKNKRIDWDEAQVVKQEAEKINLKRGL